MATAESDPTPVVEAALAEPSGPDPSDPTSPTGPEAPIPTFSTVGNVCGEGLTVIVTVDGVDVTSAALSGSWTPRLNRPAQATITTWMEDNVGDCGSLLKIEITDGVNSDIVFHGRILNVETDTDKDGGKTVYNAQDAMELWQWRPVRASDGDFSKPSGPDVTGPDIINDNVTGAKILEAMLLNTVSNDGPHGGLPPQDAEGPIGLTMGNFAEGGTPLYGAPADWPMTIAELWSLLVSTGTVDAVITYTDPGGGVTGTIDAYNGAFGTNRSATGDGSVTFSYGMGDRNVTSVRWNRDMTNMVNKYWLYGGPRRLTVNDPAGDQHWCFNIQGFDPDLPYPPGGQAVTETNDPFIFPPSEEAYSNADDPLGWKILQSRLNYDVRMKIDIFDATDTECGSTDSLLLRYLYRKQWQVFSWFSADPREIIHILPLRDIYIGCFGIGDLVQVEASGLVRGGFSGAQRVYEYTVSWDSPDSALTLSEIQTSADMEGSAG